MNKAESQMIGYVVKRYPRFSETFVVNEILAHERAGADIEIFALRPPVDTHFQNVISQVRAPVTYLPSGSVKSTEFWRTCHAMNVHFPEIWKALAHAKFASVVDAYQAIRLAIHVREKNIQHLHAHFATAAATVVQLAARVAGISYSVTMHAKDIFHESVKPDDLAAKIDQAKFVVTVSEFNRNFLTEQYGASDKIHRVYNGLDLGVFKFNRNANRPMKIISVGRLVFKKGFCHLIDACKILADNGIEFECEIIGTGELQAELQQQISKLSLTHKIQLTGPQPQNIVRKKIANSAIFAAPCVVGPDGNRDGLPTVITESLALGTPCIATDVTGIPEIILNEQTGVIVPQGNSTELAVQLQRLLFDQELRQTLARNGRDLVEREFDICKNVETIREHFATKSTRVTPHFEQLQGVR